MQRAQGVAEDSGALVPSRGRSALDLRDLVEKTDWEGKGPTNTTGSLRMDLEWILEFDG